jgi:hypothetical protein
MDTGPLGAEGWGKAGEGSSFRIRLSDIIPLNEADYSFSGAKKKAF